MKHPLNTEKAVSLFLDSRIAKDDRPLTIKWYSLILSEFASQYSQIPAKPEKIETFLTHCKGQDERRHGFYRALRAFYRFLNRRYDIGNPILKIDPPRRHHKLPKALSLENYLRLMRYKHPPDVQAYLEFISDTGCRVGELVNLNPEDFEYNSYGYVVKLDGKTGERYIPVGDKTYNSIINFIPIRYKVSWLTRRISKAFKNAGVKGTAHTLRHTFCSLWDGSESALQQITGHSNMNTLGIYRHLRMRQIAIQHKRYTLTNLLKIDYDIKANRRRG